VHATERHGRTNLINGIIRAEQQLFTGVITKGEQSAITSLITSTESSHQGKRGDTGKEDTGTHINLEDRKHIKLSFEHSE